MEMPVDVIGKYLTNNPILAMNINTELQRKFIFIPIEEIDAAEIVGDTKSGYVAGSGPEECKAYETENPSWLYNHAVNALALMRKIQQHQAPVTDAELDRALEIVDYHLSMEDNAEKPDGDEIKNLAFAYDVLRRIRRDKDA